MKDKIKTLEERYRKKGGGRKRRSRGYRNEEDNQSNGTRSEEEREEILLVLVMVVEDEVLLVLVGVVVVVVVEKGWQRSLFDGGVEDVPEPCGEGLAQSEPFILSTTMPTCSYLLPAHTWYTYTR